MKETLNPPPADQCPICGGRGTVAMGDGIKGIKKCCTCDGKGKLSRDSTGGVDAGSPKPKTLL